MSLTFRYDVSTILDRMTPPYFRNIILQHNMSILKTRDDANISVEVNGKTVASPVVLSNMPSCQNSDVLSTFGRLKWPYVYHRLGGTYDILRFVRKINDESWHLKSISVGVKSDDIALLTEIKNAGLKLDWITIDVALIYNVHFEDHIRTIRSMYPDVYLIAGNLSNPDGIRWLENLGVDCCKFGIGVSELCRTRQYTGFGSTLTDFSECVSVAKCDMMLDGGLTVLDENTGEIAYGDIYKALNLGAKFVMSSALFRWAHELSNNGIVLQYGNSTARAKNHNRHEEGAVRAFSSQYTLEDQLRKIDDHLRSGVSYGGISNVKDAYGSCKMKIV